MPDRAASYHGYRFPGEIISQAVWLYHRFCLSFRDTGDLLAQRGITVSHEATFELAEWQSLLIEGETLTASDQRLKQELEVGEEGRLLVDELRAGVRIMARSWVGYRALRAI